MSSSAAKNDTREKPAKLFFRSFHWLRPYWNYQLIALLSSLILAATALVPPWINKLLIDDVLVSRNLRALYFVSALFVMSNLIETVFAVICTWFYTKAAERAVVDIRDDLCHAFHSCSYEQIVPQSTGKIMSLFTNDVPVMQDMYASTLSECVIDILRILVSICFMFAINWQLSLITIPALLLFVSTMKAFSRPVRNVSYDVQNQMCSISHELNETISGAREIKIWRREEGECRRLHKMFMAFIPLRIRESVLMSVSSGLSSCIVVGTLALILLIGGSKAIKGQIPIGVLIAFAHYTAEIFGPVGRTFQLNNRIQKALAAAGRIVDYIDTNKTGMAKGACGHSPETAIADRSRTEIKTNDLSNGKQDDDRCNLTLQGLCYRFKDQQEDILKGISFHAKAGETIAIVGPSGSGKTTLAYLITGLYSPTSGTIRLSVSNEFQSNTANHLSKYSVAIYRDSFCFSQSVKNNILYGCPNASDEEVMDAAKAAQAHTFIIELPNQYDTEVGEHASRLSSGQAQRLNISRAFLMKPKLLILDEGTSAIDHQIEKRIKKEIRRMMQSGITITISHRLSSIIDADRIMVLNQGIIESVGTHHELIKTNKTYQEIARQNKTITERCY